MFFTKPVVQRTWRLYINVSYMQCTPSWHVHWRILRHAALHDITDMVSLSFHSAFIWYISRSEAKPQVLLKQA